MVALRTTIEVARTTERARFGIKVHCLRCAATLEQALSATEGVRAARVTAFSGETVLEFDPDFASARDLHEAIEAAGFDVEPLPLHEAIEAIRGEHVNEAREEE